MVHSLCSMNFLKVEDGNMLNFRNQPDDSKLVVIQQAFQKPNGKVQFEDIYTIRLDATKLDELILLQSLFLLDSVTDIMRLIDLQPNKELFFKSFMELDHSNLIQILSFESRFIKLLLEDVNKSTITKFIHPLFYKMQHTKEGVKKVLTPVEIACDNN